jgi:hypothetical protein
MPWQPPALLLALKIAYTLFVVILIPVYWRFYGPAKCSTRQYRC